MGWQEKRERDNYLSSHLKRVKGNPNKVKQHWIHTQEFWSGLWFTPREWWDCEGGGFRTVKTTNERRQNVAHADEYGESMVRGNRRKHNLPCSWSDRGCAAYGQRFNWKVNSKRRHQWKSSVR